MYITLRSILTIVLLSLSFIPNIYSQDIKIVGNIEHPQILVPNINDSVTITINGNKYPLLFDNGHTFFPQEALSNYDGLLFVRVGEGSKTLQSLYHYKHNDVGITDFTHIPLWLSIVPPLIAIIIALIFKEVIISLFIGIWSGAFIAGGMRIEGGIGVIKSLFNTIAHYIIEALSDPGHISVIIFSMLIGGMVAIISKNGGMAGVVNKLSRYAKDDKSSQFITWLLGVAIFFDDYANTLIVGNTMRSVTDKYNVSREKLAYIVDSTAAPVAAVAFITTWIGAELGYIDSGIQLIDNWDPQMTTYSIFISSLKYSFYPFFALIFMLFLILKQRDFGPMLKAERRARQTGQVSPAQTSGEDKPDMEDLSPLPNALPKWYNAVVPIMGVILVTIFGLVSTGFDSIHSQITEIDPQIHSNKWSYLWTQINLINGDNPGFIQKLGIIIGSSDSYVALLWASMSGVIIAILMSLWSRIMSLQNTIHYMTMGFKTMMPAIIILTLAWGLAITTEELQTADYLSSILHGNVNPLYLPAIIFVLAAIISFSTGSSWSTMAILYPIAIPTTWILSMEAGINEAHSIELLLNVIATILAASVLGDHCSPISDTTILSSLSSDCNHLDHVKTQLPYALTAGSIAFICVFLSTYLGEETWHNYMLGSLGIIALFCVAHFYAKPIIPDK